MVELVYTQDLKSCAHGIEGSSPSSATFSLPSSSQVRTPGFHPGNTGSNPVGSIYTNIKGDQNVDGRWIRMGAA